MKTSQLFSPKTRALICGLVLLGAPQIARAQPADQPQTPQPPQSALRPDATVALPAQFSAAQFFDALAKAANARIVAPLPGDTQLARLRQTAGAQTLTVKQIFPLYEQAMGYRFSNSNFDGDLIKVRLPDETIYPTPPVDQRYQPFLRLLLALSREQIDQMYLRGTLSAQDLTPAQIPLYLEARRKNPNVAFGAADEKSLTDAQILAQPLRFRFAFTATASLPDNEQVWPLGLYNYGTGLIWDPLVGANTKALQDAAFKPISAPAGQTYTVGVTSEQSRLVVLEFPQTQATTVGAAFDAVEQKLGQKIVFDASLDPQKLRAQPVVISAGRYRADELMTAVAASVGLDNLFRNGVPTLELRAPAKTDVAAAAPRRASATKVAPFVASCDNGMAIFPIPFRAQGRAFFRIDRRRAVLSPSAFAQRKHRRLRPN